MKETPTEEEITEFWRELYESDVTHNHQAEWLPQIKQELSHTKEMEAIQIKEETK